MVVAVLPLLLLSAASAWGVAGWAAGGSPFWPDPAMTMSEAAALGNRGEIVRLITVEHQDPNQAWPVRAGIMDTIRTATPLEAAVIGRRMEVFDVLLHYGAVVPNSGPVRATLVCRAVTAPAPDILERLLKMGDGSDPRPDCPRPSN